MQTQGSAKPGTGDSGGGSVSGAHSASDGERLTLWQDQGQEKRRPGPLETGTAQ